MAFCSFDQGAALFDATPVENMFISEYMLRAPGEFVKVYLYGLMLCYHHAERMSLASMARDLDATLEEVENAFAYWEREGLVRRTGDNPVSYTFYNLKQITLARAEKPGEQLYNRHFMDEVRRTLDAQTVSDSDYQTVLDWVQIYELPEEVVVMLLRNEKEKSRTGRVSFKIADNAAKEWAQSGVRTLEDAERMLILSGERERELKRLFARLGMRRNPSEDEKTLYRKWTDEWGFTPDAIQEACRETTKSTTPTMAYLDGILLRQHQLGRHGAQEILGGFGREKTARDFAREVLAGLGRTGITPTGDDLALIESWRAAGNSDELILLAVTAAHRRKDGGTMETVGNWLEKWTRQGLTTPEAVTAHNNRQKALNAQLREIYDAAGFEKNTNQPDRDLLCRWMGEMGMSMELVLQAAQYARGSASPMMTMNRILSDWHRAGITTQEAARAEHESHMQGGRQPAPQAARTQDTLLRYTPEERRATYSAAVLDFDEEDS